MTQGTAKLSKETPQIVLWHHRLAHTSYTTLETMKRLHTVNGYYPNVHSGPIPQCISCPFGKQIRSLFQHTEKIPTNIGDLVVSDVCGPFELSINGYKYFITWIDCKSRFSTLDFLKNKECKTIIESFRNIWHGYYDRNKSRSRGSGQIMVEST